MEFCVRVVAAFVSLLISYNNDLREYMVNKEEVVDNTVWLWSPAGTKTLGCGLFFCFAFPNILHLGFAVRTLHLPQQDGAA